MFRYLFAILLLIISATCHSDPIHIVAAENFYGNIAKEIGGEYVQVDNILNNPNQDPHLFSASSQTAKALAQADIVVYNGIGYDTWMDRLLSIESHKPRDVIIVSQLLNKKMGDNPHIWYNPQTMPLYAKALADKLIKLDPQHQSYYSKQLQQFNQNYNTLITLINQVKKRFQNTPIIATEPVFGDMAHALSLQMHSQDFQIKIMNDIAPSPLDMQNFESALRQHKVKLLIYNNQVSNPLTQRMRAIAINENIATVGISETQPTNTTYIEWMINQLKQLESALSERH